MNGSCKESKKPVPFHELEQYWTSLMAQESTPLGFDMGPLRSAIHVLAGIIPDKEVEHSLKTLSDGAKGLDGLSRTDLRSVPIESLAAHCNLWLLTACPRRLSKKSIRR